MSVTIRLDTDLQILAAAIIAAAIIQRAPSIEEISRKSATGQTAFAMDLAVTAVKNHLSRPDQRH